MNLNDYGVHVRIVNNALDALWTPINKKILCSPGDDIYFEYLYHGYLLICGSYSSSNNTLCISEYSNSYYNIIPREMVTGIEIAKLWITYPIHPHLEDNKMETSGRQKIRELLDEFERL